MDLDSKENIQKFDSLNILGCIDQLPDQVSRAWEFSQSLQLPLYNGIKLVLISCMGGSAAAAELLAEYAASHCQVPVIIHRDYGLPAFASGKETLFIASSCSGNTEEVLDAFDQAVKKDCSLFVITGGGKLSQRAAEAGCPVWQFSFDGPSKAAIGYSFFLLLRLFSNLGFLQDQSVFVTSAIQVMKIQQDSLRADVPAAQNPAKRYAGQLVGRWVTVFASGVMSGVARRWKGQINEMAKAPANFEILPEADHNTLAGILNPAMELLMPHTMSMFIRTGSDHPRNAFRAVISRQTCMLEGLNTDVYLAPGDDCLSQMWAAILFGEYLAYYLAIAYKVDPSSEDGLVSINTALSVKK